MSEYIGLILASIAFVGTHCLMSHPLRAPMVSKLGDNGFMGIYSVVSLGTFIWMVNAFKAAPPATPVWAVGDGLWAAASVLTLLAAILFAGSLSGNPALPAPGADALAAREPSGVFRVTRHPMMWGFGLWGIGHILIAPRLDSFIFVGAIIFLALVGAKAQDAKKARAMGASWQQWQSRTSYWPNLLALPRAGWLPWVAGIAIWAIATWAHGWFGYGGAGAFRWL